MSDDIEQKIEELLSEFNEIDTKVNKLINGARIQTISPDISPEDLGERIFDLTDIPRDAYKFESPNVEFDRLQRQIVQQYGCWYNEAENIVAAYLPDKINEFRYLKGGNSLEYGIMSILRFEKVYENEPNKRDIIREFTFKFDAQKNILIGFARTIHLLPPKKTESKSTSALELPASKATTIIAHRDVNIHSRTTNIDINDQKFNELRAIVQKSNETKELKEILLSQINDLESSNGTLKYVESFQKFMETAANSATLMTALTSLLPFLSGLLQS